MLIGRGSLPVSTPLAAAAATRVTTPKIGSPVVAPHFAAQTVGIAPEVASAPLSGQQARNLLTDTGVSTATQQLGPTPTDYAASMAQQNSIAQAAQQRAQDAIAAIQATRASTAPALGSTDNAANSASYNYSVPAVNGGLTPESFARELLQGLGDKTTPTAMSELERWMRQEGGNWENDAAYNPLNTTQAMPGYHEVGTQGNIAAYQNWEQGLKATLETLNNGRYGQILQALKSGASPAAFYAAVDSSPWGTKGL